MCRICQLQLVCPPAFFSAERLSANRFVYLLSSGQDMSAATGYPPAFFSAECLSANRFVYLLSSLQNDSAPTGLFTVPAFFCPDVPAVCGKAEVIDWAPTFADLLWTPPSEDGGTPILTYIIQMKGNALYKLPNITMSATSRCHTWQKCDLSYGPIELYL